MENLDKLYNEIARLTKLADDVKAGNYDSSVSLAEQADDLEEIGQIVKQVAPVLRKIHTALGG